MDTSPNSDVLDVLPFHTEMIAYLRSQEKALWSWFSEPTQLDAYADAIRLELLKTTYRLDRETHGKLYALAEEAVKKLGLTVPVTFYQSQRDHGVINAAVCCLPGEAHIVLVGAVLETLNDLELSALVGHELGHFKLRLCEEGRLGIADRLMDAIAADDRAEPSHIFSAARHRQYAEIYADRCSWVVCGDVNAAIGCLVKVTTGLKEINPQAYVAQADEVFSKGEVSSQGQTHPETFIRARALSKWARGDADSTAEIRQMIEGRLHLDSLDLLGQTRLTSMTRRLVDVIHGKKWMRSEPLLAQSRMLFPDFVVPKEDHSDDALMDELRAAHPSVQDYACFIMLDFAAADPALEELPLVYVLYLAEKMERRDRLEELANRELKITKKALAKLRQDGAEMLERAGQA